MFKSWWKDAEEMKKVFLLTILVFSSLISAQTGGSGFPKSIQQFCSVLERDILFYYQTEIENNRKFIDNSLSQSERNQSREIALQLKDSRVKTEESWHRIGCFQIIPRK